MRLALLVVGLDRSPENLLNPRHSDSEMVKALGCHHDAVVSQYSVWAITENDKLRLAHLGLELKDIETHPDNVRAWLFQLLAIEATPAEPHWEYIRLGMEDPSIEARKGLATGLRNTFVDVFEPMVMDWVATEPDPDVRQHLMDHTVRQAEHSAQYHRYAVEIYDGEPPDSTLRGSMESSAAQTPIYTVFRQIGAGAQGLFGGDIVMGNKTTSIGNVNAGAVAFDGSTATNRGKTKIQVISQMQVQQIQSELAKLEAALHADKDLAENEKRKALTAVAEAKDDPSPTKVGKVVEVIGYLGTLAEAGTALAPYATALGGLIGIG